WNLSDANARLRFISAGIAVSRPVFDLLRLCYQEEIRAGPNALSFVSWLNSWIADPLYTEVQPEDLQYLHRPQAPPRFSPRKGILAWLQPAVGAAAVVLVALFVITASQGQANAQ